MSEDDWDSIGATHDATDEELLDIIYALDQSAIIAITDHKGKITYVNNLFTKISQYSENELLGEDHRIVNSEYHPPQFFKNMWATIGRGNVWRGEIRNKKKDGCYYWLDTKIIPFLNAKGIPYKYIAIRNEITEKKQLEKEFKRRNAMYRLIADNSDDFISVIDSEGNFQYVSPSHEKILGYKLSSLISGNIYSIIVEVDKPNVKEQVNRVQNLGTSVISNEFRMQDVWGKVIYTEMTINPILDSGEYEGNMVLVIRDITTRKEADLKIHDLVSNDQLTLMPNRVAFRKRLRLEVKKTVNDNAFMGLVFLNIDRLRDVNDSFGHETGDYFLAVIGKRLKAMVPEEGIVGRLGGDEFAFLLKNVKDAEQVEKVIQEIQKYVESPIEVRGELLTPSVSIGVAFCPTHGEEPMELVLKTETALYNMKARGGGGYEIYQPGTARKSLERVLLENELRKSVLSENFSLDYQPKMDLRSGKLVGVEALVRWNHPDLGRIAPDKFIPVAEETKLILPLGEWVLREACMQAKKWQEKKYEPFRVGVNMSAVQLEEPNILQTIKSILEETNVAPKFIEMELTESVFANREGLRTKVEEIRELGISVSIDDFGTGYSTFSYIKELPADTLKIDMAFIRDIHKNEESRAIVQAIVTLAKTVGLNVIAEGVEYKEQVDVLLACGCQEGQGYFYSKPVSAKGCERFMRKAKSIE